MVKRENNKIHTTQSSKSMQSLSSPSAASSNDKKKKYKGVRMRSWGSWVSEIRAPNQKTRIWLGSYSTAEAAARAYDAALLCLKGSSANLNFPLTSSHYIPQQNTAMSPKSIQRVAAAAANSFMDNANSNSSIAPPSTLIVSTSSSLVSSPISMSSSPSNQIDDDFSLLSSFKAYTSCDQTHESMAMMDSWYGFDGYHVDQMLSGTLFDIDSTQLFDDLYEESDIRLWNFR
ncbi:hypothetical protein Lal_00025443 [Lupinus albus]|uniref:Putative transcription factor AP2-EREBP family n=1 Tax=Lupinus albus TaxID=3870 RepID=A0A6A5NYP1_LUPAL|nr:putative transcription factor AP2-EREBP family [Lupinus albus]KAF1890110.1 hypothetical protein Lal_00025443 [Lupinus albus]